MNHLLAQVDLGKTPLSDSRTLSSYTNLGSIINALLKNVFVLAGIILIGLVIIGGIQYIQAAGSDDSKKAAQAQATLTDAAIGFAVVILAYFIVQIIETVTGLKILNPGF